MTRRSNLLSLAGIVATVALSGCKTYQSQKSYNRDLPDQAYTQQPSTPNDGSQNAFPFIIPFLEALIEPNKEGMIEAMIEISKD